MPNLIDPTMLRFGSFLVLLLFSLVPTYFIYRVLGRYVDENPGSFGGNVGGFAVKFGGPAAFYLFLLVFGEHSLPAASQIQYVKLQGVVKDRKGDALEGYEIGVIPQMLSLDSQGRFTLRYQLVIFKICF